MQVINAAVSVAKCVQFVKSWPTGPYPGTAERAGGETGWCSTDWARPGKRSEIKRMLKNIYMLSTRNHVWNAYSTFRMWALYLCKHNILYLWLCAAVSRALRGGVGDPCSVTLSTSRLFLSGRQRPWRVSIGESTRFRGGSAEERNQ